MSNHNLSNRYSSELIESIVNLHQSVQYANLLSKEYDVCVSSIKLWIKQSYMKDRNFLSVSEK